MLLTGHAIGEAIARGEIVFEPFSPERLNPNSISLQLGASITEVRDGVIEAGALVAGQAQPIPQTGALLAPGALYLAHSLERFGSAVYAPIVHGKSNIARAGLFIHANGEMVDLGVIGHFEFQLTPVLPIRVFAGMAIGQVTFWRVER